MKQTQQRKWGLAASLALVALLAASSSATAQLIITKENQNSNVTFTPTWTVPTTDNLIYGLTPSSQYGNFTLESSGGVPRLTDGLIGPVMTPSGNWANIYATAGDGGGAGASATYTLPNTANGYNITNITVYSGWANNGRDGQDYNVSYSTKANPTSFISLGYVDYNPSIGNNRPSINRSIWTDWAGGAIASNVYALKFTFNAQHVENGYAGYAEITVLGTPATSVSAAPLVISTETQYGNSPSLWSIETTSSLIYNAWPTDFDLTGNAERDGDYGILALTDGTFMAVDSNQSYASLGGSPSVSTITYSLDTASRPDGYDLTNILAYTGWKDGGLDGQFYTVSYSSVLTPRLFVPIASVCINPARTNDLPMANRVVISMAGGATLATNVGAIKFDFAPQSENGRCQYAELAVGGVPSLTPSTAPPAPTLVSSGPAIATSVVGDKVIFSAQFDGTIPTSYQWQKNGVNVPGGTLSSLTLNSVQLADAGYYRLTAFNATNNAGVTYTPLSTLIVNSLPTATNNIIIKYAAQTGNGGTNVFTPSWEMPGFSLIAGQSNPTVGIGNFNDPDTNPLATNTAAGISVLTDGSYGYLDNGLAHPTFATCGVNGAGNSVTYILGTAPQGYEVTNIQTYGGWNNAGRDEQKYTIRYSTVAAPTIFNALLAVDYNPYNPNNAQSMTRLSIIPATGALAHSVYAIMFDFNMGGSSAKNGYEGYSEIVVGGTPTLVPAPILIQDINALAASDVVGGQITLTASFSGATSYHWKKDGVDIAGATTPTLIFNNLQITNTAIYTLVAYNGGGTSSSRGCALTVNPVPAPVGNVVTAIAAQNADASIWAPSWPVSTNNSLIAGKFPTSSGGDFNKEPQAGDRNVSSLTAGGSLALSIVGDPVTTSSNYVTAGNGLGSFLIYSLGNAVNGYDLTNIVVFGGWGDRGRDQQGYTVRYSTAAAPTTFLPLAVVSYNPDIAAGLHSAIRATLTATNGVLVSNVAAVEFDFSAPSVENGFTGYGAINIFGTPSALPPPPGLVITTENQNTSAPAWTIETSSLIAGQMPNDAGTGNFSCESGVGGPAVLTDAQYSGVTAGNYVTCGGSAGHSVTYNSADGWILTNIVVYSGWGNYNRDGQFYDVYYSTLAAPTTWIKLASVSYNPSEPTVVDGGSANRVAIAMTDGSVLASNVAAVKFDFSVQSADNGYSGYSEIVLQGSSLPGKQPVITAENQQGSFSWSAETNSLIAGKLPSSTGPGVFTGEGCNVTNLTDGVIGFGANFGASCGSDTNASVSYVTFNSTSGWNLSNIVVYSLWSDYGREGQYYDVSYSTLSAPSIFLPLASVTFNPFVPTGIRSGNRVTINPALGQTMLASNVATIRFDFTPQGASDFGWSGYSEIVLLGSNGTAPTPWSFTSYTVSNGNLFLAGVGAPHSAYNVLSSTNVAAPLANWTSAAAGTSDGSGVFTATIPVDPTKPARFFRFPVQ